ncbi:branched-chain amino acid ABC transporter permease [Mycolicibacterium austroafricanum]|uniref:Branched-chain amino acid ABC transporter permease n=1 Tax=Mycolicibacterium austroafricanum TaxID=39687 RepID=A0ABT8HIC1_MYCAO|nr:branched-chain amino acid ABC transporter permease [Mycolicibacterium austroafricanum]MDN4520506.1 branched-chain amino acid ABC transporter permease [Mycolicibacterium austroafricanum]
MNAGLVLDGLTTGGLFFIVTLGLLIVFGMMKLINFAHGAFLALGAYTCVLATSHGLPVWLPILLAPVVTGVVAAVVEPIVLRRLYGRPMDTLLATWGLNMIIIQLITLYFGRGTQPVKTVDLGAVDVFGTTYSLYRLLFIPVAVALGLSVALVLNKTRLGLVGRAVIMDENLAQISGINNTVVRFATFVFGSALAGLAGALLTPIASVDPNIGVPWLFAAFMISLLVGISPAALGVACVLLGMLQVLLASLWDPTIATLAVPVAVVLILRFFPQGFVKGARVS